MFDQVLLPVGSLWSTVFLALVPLIAMLFLLAAFRITAWLATLIGGLLTVVLGVWVWHAPLAGTFEAYLYGNFQGIWVIDWITFWGLVIFNTLVVSGNFATFKSWLLHHATSDIRIQTLILAWAFGALLEGLVGFGYPWAVVVPILAGLGIADIDAIRVAALANNAPVSFGALGVPVLALAAVTGLPAMALSASVGNIVAVLALLPPWVLIFLVSGWQGLKESWLLAIVASFSYIAGQWPVARYFGPYLPDVTGALVSFWVLLFFARRWHPKNIRGFGGTLAPKQVTDVGRDGVAIDRGPNPADPGQRAPSFRDGFLIWLPYIVLILIVVAWTGPWSTLPKITLFKLQMAARSSVTHKPLSATFSFQPFAGGSSILVSWLAILAVVRPKPGSLKQVFARTFHQMWGALLVAAFVFGLGYVFIYSGMANSLAYGFSKLGVAFVVLAPVLGWIGVALSGSNTSTNVMFGPVQAVAGNLLHLPNLLLPSLNSVGAEVGKPIAPQTASVGVSTSTLVRSEGDVIRHNMMWTLIVLVYVIIIGLLYYLFLPDVMKI